MSGSGKLRGIGLHVGNGRTGGVVLAWYVACDRGKMVGCGGVDLNHVFALAYYAAKGALGANAAKWLVFRLAV